VYSVTLSCNKWEVIYFCANTATPYTEGRPIRVFLLTASNYDCRLCNREMIVIIHVEFFLKELYPLSVNRYSWFFDTRCI